LVEKGNNFAISGKLNVSQHYNISLNPVFGQEYFLNFRKVSGKFRFGVSRLSRSDTYDPNDLGYLQRNNETCNKLNLGYYEFKPLWKFLNWFASFEINQSNLYAPNKFAELSFRLITEATLKNNSRIGLQSVLFPIERHDYYESREAGRVFIRPATYEVSASFIPDYKKKIGIGLIAAIENSFASVFDQHSYYIKINPSYRPNNKFRIGYDIQSQINKQETGYVDNLEEDILFGKRNVNTLINTITSSYIFNRKASLSLKIRHYWSTVVYDEYFVLRGDGYLDKTDYSGNYNINYNAFNVDLFYTWNFAPGSELSVMWKNIILHNEDAVSMNYFENLDHILSFPQTNSISVKLLYYIDYQQIKKKFQG
jgi:hypothetical protein